MLKLILILGALAAIGFVYVRTIRPTLHALPHMKAMYDRADGFWQNLWVKARAYWDLLVSGSLVVLPQLPDLLSQISGTDLDALIPSDTAKAVTAAFGIASILIRAFIMRQTAAG